MLKEEKLLCFQKSFSIGDLLLLLFFLAILSFLCCYARLVTYCHPCLLLLGFFSSFYYGVVVPSLWIAILAGHTLDIYITFHKSRKSTVIKQQNFMVGGNHTMKNSFKESQLQDIENYCSRVFSVMLSNQYEISTFSCMLLGYVLASSDHLHCVP